MKIMKFGGTSVGKPERMMQVASLVTRDTDKKIVVLSALSGTTNALVSISQALMENNRLEAKSIIDELYNHYLEFIEGLLQKEETRQKALDVVNEHFEFLNIILKISYSEALQKDILAQGELMSTKLFAIYLEEIGTSHKLLPALDFMTLDADDEPQIGTIKVKLSQALKKHNEIPVFITQGYITKNAKGEVDNLKRGGSDYTASLIAAALNADVCEIWTDIDGMHNNDPRVVEKTKAIEQLSFDEAAELAYFGAKILHPASIWPAQTHNVPVKLLNTMQPEALGTTISSTISGSGVKAVAAKDNIIALKIKSSRMLLAYGFLRKVFEVFEKYRTSIDMITTSEVAVSVTIDESTHLHEIVKELEAFGTVEVDMNQTIVSIVGNRLADQEDILKDLFDSLHGINVRMVSYGGSRHNVSLLINRNDKENTLKAVNRGLFGF